MARKKSFFAREKNLDPLLIKILLVLGVIAAIIFAVIFIDPVRQLIIDIVAALINAFVLSNLFVFNLVVIAILLVLIFIAIYIYKKL